MAFKIAVIFTEIFLYLNIETISIMSPRFIHRRIIDASSLLCKLWSVNYCVYSFHPVFFIIIAVVSIINVRSKTFMCIVLTWKDTREVINLNYSISFFFFLPPCL